MNQGVLDQIVDLFVNNAARWQGPFTQAAENIFYALAVIELVIAVGFCVARRGDMADLFAVVIQQMITIGFFWWVLQGWPGLANGIIATFEHAGVDAAVAAGGRAGTSPTTVFWAGMSLAKPVWDAMSIGSPVLSMVLGVTGIVVMITFGLIASELVIVLIETAFAVYGSIILMAFGPLVYTRDIAIAQFRWVMGVGVKRMVMALLAGMGSQIVLQWAASLKGGQVTDWTTIAVMLGAPIVLWQLVNRVPAMAQQMVAGAYIHSPGRIGSTGESVARAAVVAAIAATGAGAAGVGAMRLASAQVARATASGGAAAGASRAQRAAMMAGYTARNLGSSVASDVGKRLTGQYAARHGHSSWRAAQSMNQQRRSIQAQNNNGNNP